MFGFYSRKAEIFCGSFVYSTPEGKEVVVTLVDDRPDVSGLYRWPDASPVGEVFSFVRQCVPDPRDRLKLGTDPSHDGVVRPNYPRFWWTPLS